MEDIEISKKAKYEKIVNTLCNRIDKSIVACSEMLANAEYMQQVKAQREAREKETKFKAAKREEEIKKQEKINTIRKLVDTLNKEISTFDSPSDTDMKDLYHSIGITESVLFEKEDDHLRIKGMYIPLLKFLDLSYIDFSNVDIRYIDFRGTNAIIRPQKVYNKDASYAKFDDNNLPDWLDYKSVNLSGSELDENITTLLNRDKAIINEETVIKRRLNK